MLPSGFITLRVLDFLRGKKGFFHLDVDNLKVLYELRTFGVFAGRADRVQFFAFREPAVILGKRIPLRKLELGRNSRIRLTDLSQILISLGWERVDFAEDVGQFAIRGGVLDMVFENMALRFVLDGDVIEDVKEFSPYTQISISRSDGIFILLPDPEGEMGEEIQISASGISPNPPFLGDFKRAVDYAREMRERDYRVVFFGNPVRSALETFTRVSLIFWIRPFISVNGRFWARSQHIQS